ncbi:MAG: 50S ribosomal protein L3 [Phycisphaerae bacterium]
MLAALLGRKIGMTRVFDKDGASVPVTVVEAGPCTVLQVRTQDHDAYHAIQLGFADTKPGRCTLPAIGHAAKAGATPKAFVREVRLSEPAEVKAGEVLNVERFEGVTRVDVIGTTRGFGFQGVMKRYHFGGQPGSHGTERKHRSPGSIGGMAGDRGRGRSVKRGKKMPGHMGHNQRTGRNQRVMAIDKDKNILLIEGAVPGPRNGFVLVRESKKAIAKAAKKSKG